MLGFLASQLVEGADHAHAGMTPEQRREHDARPHIHFHPHTDSHSHDSHSHEDGGRGHTHGSHKHGHERDGVRNPFRHEEGDEGSERSPEEPATSPLGVVFDALEHDAEACVIWVDVDVATSGGNGFLRTAWALEAQAASVEGFLAYAERSIRPLHRRQPDEVLDASDAYLLLRQLRI